MEDDKHLPNTWQPHTPDNPQGPEDLRVLFPGSEEGLRLSEEDNARPLEAQRLDIERRLQDTIRQRDSLMDEATAVTLGGGQPSDETLHEIDELDLRVLGYKEEKEQLQDPQEPK